MSQGPEKTERRVAGKRRQGFPCTRATDLTLMETQEWLVGQRVSWDRNKQKLDSRGRSRPSFHHIQKAEIKQRVSFHLPHHDLSVKMQLALPGLA